ncbi:LIPS lipase, partial [Glaucidium brasilianum]|nr:LIPS lipase [Glaucidium brasilianum]
GDLGSSRPHPPDSARKSLSEAAGGLQEEQPSPSSPLGAPHHGEGTPKDGEDTLEYPDEFQPLRSRGPPACFELPPAPLARNPYMSPLLAPDGMLGGLPPVHLVACALDPMLDDSVALARRLRAL